MKGIELLPQIEAKEKRWLEESALQYRRFARVFIEVLDVQDERVCVKVQQRENNLERYLNREELLERASKVFEGVLPEGWIIEYVCIPFQLDLGYVDLGYIVQNKSRFGLTDTDLANLLDIKKENLSRILSENSPRELTKWHKAAFYYLFKSLAGQTGEWRCE